MASQASFCMPGAAPVASAARLASGPALPVVWPVRARLFGGPKRVRGAGLSPLSALPSGPGKVLDRPAAPAIAPAPSGTATSPAASAADAAATPAMLVPPQASLGGLACLAVVPLLWGTYNPCIRYLYAEPDALSPAALTATRTVVSAVALLLPAAIGWMWQEGRAAMARSRADSAAEASSSGAVADGSVSHPHHHGPLRVELAAAGDGAAEGVAAAADEAAAEEAAAAAAASTSASSTGLLAEPLSTVRMGPVLTTTFNSVVIAGLELGLLNFLGTALQVEGLHSVSATRAGFLAEVTAVLTPLVSYAAGYTIPPQMWAAVAVGLVGSTMVAYDASQGGSEGPQAGPVAAPAAAAAAPAVADSASTAAATGVAATATASTAADAASSLSAAAPVDPVTSLAAAASAVAETAAGAPTGIEVGPPSLELTAANAANAVAAAAAAAPSASDAASLAASLEPAGPALSDAAAALSDAAADAAASVAGAAGAALEAASTAASSAATEAAVAAVSNAAAAATAAAEPLAITGGETYLLLACLFFSICTVRMGIYSPRMDTVQLAAMKKVGLSSMSVMWMATASLQGGAALSSALAFPDLSDRAPLSIAVLLYSGLGPGALATYLQVEGLSTVPATTAQVIYSFTPLATAFFAHTFLGGEATGPVAWVGGCLLIAAALMAARAQYVQAKEQQAAAATAAAAAAAAGPSASNGSGSGTQ